MKNKKDDVISMRGVVVKNQSHDLFIVKDDKGREFACRPSGRLRNNHIKVVIGDVVDFEVSVYDLTKGRIVYRH